MCSSSKQGKVPIISLFYDMCICHNYMFICGFYPELLCYYATLDDFSLRSVPVHMCAWFQNPVQLSNTHTRFMLYPDSRVYSEYFNCQIKK